MQVTELDDTIAVAYFPIDKVNCSFSGSNEPYSGFMFRLKAKGICPQMPDHIKIKHNETILEIHESFLLT